MPWQKWLAEQSLKIKSDGRWKHPISIAMLPRQQGKEHLHAGPDMMGMFEWNESLQIASAHRLVTSLEQFRASLSQMIEEARGFGSGKAHPLATWSRGNPIA
jgi:hypothetical protein